MKRKRILYLSTAKNKDDKREWSGTVYHSLHALMSAGYDVDYKYVLNGFKQDVVDKLWFRYWCFIARYFKKNVRFDESYHTLRMMRRALKDIDYSKYDIIFVPTDMCIMMGIPKNVKAKLVHLVDAPVDSLFNYYTEFSNLTLQNRLEASYITRSAFRRADLIIASSNWCKNESIVRYDINPDKISVVEFGANMDNADIPELIKSYDSSRPLRIYWSGVNWERKGGDIALDCCRELKANGYEIEFHITGMKTLPQDAKDLPWVMNHGFLDKNNPEEYHRLIEIMGMQDIFLFPSRAECSSIALCEANAFGLPCFVYDTGGTANYVENGKNGFMLPLEAKGKEFADKIISCMNKDMLHTLSINARRKYVNSLNWEVWSRKVGEEMNNIK